MVQWDKPERGLTNSPVEHYNVECSDNLNNYTYSIKTTADRSTQNVQLPVSFTSPASYNCCVEVEFEAYSSIACKSVRLEYCQLYTRGTL